MEINCEYCGELIQDVESGNNVECPHCHLNNYIDIGKMINYPYEFPSFTMVGILERIFSKNRKN